jgi:hypothetical protein
MRAAEGGEDQLAAYGWRGGTVMPVQRSYM